MEDRIHNYKKTEQKDYNKTIINLNYRNFGYWSPRETTEISIKKWYNVISFQTENINLISNKNGNFDLHENAKKIDNKNIFYNLCIEYDDSIENADFSLYYGNKCIIRLSGYANNLFLHNRRKSKNGQHSIILFECFEKGFIDILSFQDKSLEIRINGLSKDKYKLYVDTCKLLNKENIIDKTEYIFTEEICHFNLQNNILEIDKKLVSMGLYLRFWNISDQKKSVNVKNMTVTIKDIVWNYNSSRIMIDNKNNFHHIWFFPDSDDDFIKAGKIFGLNLGCIDPINISLETNLSIDKIDCGVFFYNVIKYNYNCSSLIF